jgi:ketosteroid isomerase-like protein
MDAWEAIARESIRDIVARYNANADSGRLEAAMSVFAPDARLEMTEAGETVTYDGREAIHGLLAGTQAKWIAAATRRAANPYVRHFLSTHLIEINGEEFARGRSYVAVLMAHGLDHWGRYVDQYRKIDGTWLIAHRRVMTDGRTGSLAP